MHVFRLGKPFLAGSGGRTMPLLDAPTKPLGEGLHDETARSNLRRLLLPLERSLRHDPGAPLSYLPRCSPHAAAAPPAPARATRVGRDCGRRLESRRMGDEPAPDPPLHEPATNAPPGLTDRLKAGRQHVPTGPLGAPDRHRHRRALRALLRRPEHAPRVGEVRVRDDARVADLGDPAVARRRGRARRAALAAEPAPQAQR